MGRSFTRAVVVAALAVLVPAATALPVQAAAKPRASVTITDPQDGASGPGAVTVSGKATLSSTYSLRLVVSTIGSSVPVTPGSKGAWSVQLTDLILGPTTICAEVRDGGGGYVTASCVRYTVTPSPERFTLTTPAEGDEVTLPLEVGGACEYDTLVDVTTDTGLTAQASCDFWSRTWSTTLSGSGEGRMTVSATESAGTTPIATRGVTVVVVPHPAPTVEITAPADGAVLYAGAPVGVTGTATPGIPVQLLLDDLPFGGAWADAEGAWTADVTLTDPGSHRLCAVVEDVGGRTNDCVDVGVAIDPASLSIDTPGDGLATYETDLLVTGSCYPGTTVEVAAAGSSETVDCAGGYGVYLTGLPEGTQAVAATMSWQGDVVTSRQVTVTIDTTAPEPAVISSPAPGSTLTSTPVTLVGTAEPGAGIEVLLPDQFEYVATTADEAGAWTAVLGRDYFEYAGVLTGRRAQLTVYVRVTDGAGNTSLPTAYTYTTRMR